MAISEVISPSGVKSFTVYVNLRSKPMPHVRFQKRVSGIRTQTEAMRVERTVVKELSMKIAHTEGHGFTWRMVVDQWASFVESPLFMDRQYNPATITDYVSMMQTWTKEWLDRPAAEISRGDGREVLDRVLVQGRSKAFQKRVKNTVNMIFNWGIETKVIRGVTCSPVYGLRIVVKEERRPEILKLDEMRKLLSEARAINHEWYFVWAVALLTGMRNGELYALRWSDVDLDKGLITVQRSFNKRTGEFKSTKAGYWRTVPVSGELRGLLVEMLSAGSGKTTITTPADETAATPVAATTTTSNCSSTSSTSNCSSTSSTSSCGGGGKIPISFHHEHNHRRSQELNGFVLPRIKLWDQGQQARALKYFCRKIELSPIKFHTLRACFATQLISEGVEPIKVMKVCGWLDLKTMARYVRLAGIEESGITEKIKLL